MQASQVSRRSVLKQTGALLSGLALSRLATGAPAAPDSSPAAAAGTIVIGGDMTVNRMGFGAMRVTGPGIWGDPADPAEARRVLQRAVELGVNFIDTADAYGPAVNESLIAAALRPYPNGLVIATKGGIVRPSQEQWERDGRPEHLRAACDASLKRLGLERIDLYQLHAIDPNVPLEESLGEIARLQKEGKIRHVGVSNFDADELATSASRTSTRTSSPGRARSSTSSRCRIATTCRIVRLIRCSRCASAMASPSSRGRRCRRVRATRTPGHGPGSKPGLRSVASRFRRRRSRGCWPARRRCCRFPARRR